MLPATPLRCAPTRSLVPRISTEKPRLSPAPPSPAASFCSSVQAPLLRPNTYAAPWSADVVAGNPHEQDAAPDRDRQPEAIAGQAVAGVDTARSRSLRWVLYTRQGP